MARNRNYLRYREQERLQPGHIGGERTGREDWAAGRNAYDRSGYPYGMDDYPYGEDGSYYADYPYYWRRGRPYPSRDHDNAWDREQAGRYGIPGSYRSGNPYSDSNDRGMWDRATDEMASWFGDEEARHRRHMDEHRGRGPEGYRRSDDRINEDVHDRLTDDPALDASRITVEVQDGEVTLNGLVSDRADKRRAEDDAEAVSGVQHVQNNIRVRPREASDQGQSA